MPWPAWFVPSTPAMCGQLRPQKTAPGDPTRGSSRAFCSAFKLDASSTIQASSFRYDKDTFPVKPLRKADGVRVVPGGSALRSGAYVAPGVVCMPPMYINVGAYVDEETMVDSHALVGSCAQIGKRVHLSAAAQVGGVLEPVHATPVVV